MIDQVSSQYRKPSLISTSSYDIYNGGPSKPGISGYDPEEPDMRGVFMARGPGKLTKDLVLRILLAIIIYTVYQISNKCLTPSKMYKYQGIGNSAQNYCNSNSGQKIY